MREKDLLEEMDPIFPGDFFRYRIPLYRDPVLLPEISGLLSENSLGSVALGWSREGVYGTVSVRYPVEECCFPDYRKGDAFELFLDTRDNKRAGAVHRFCHAFVFFPSEIQGVHACEVTKFRAEDTHPLCDPSDLTVSTQFTKKGYELTFCVRAGALHGYDPEQFPSLGFAYRIHAKGKQPENFPLSDRYFDPLQHPAFWASLVLERA